MRVFRRNGGRSAPDLIPPDQAARGARRIERMAVLGGQDVVDAEFVNLPAGDRTTAQDYSRRGGTAGVEPASSGRSSGHSSGNGPAPSRQSYFVTHKPDGWRDGVLSNHLSRYGFWIALGGLSLASFWLSGGHALAGLVL